MWRQILAATSQHYYSDEYNYNNMSFRFGAFRFGEVLLARSCYISRYHLRRSVRYIVGLSFRNHFPLF